MPQLAFFLGGQPARLFLAEQARYPLPTFGRWGESGDIVRADPSRDKIDNFFVDLEHSRHPRSEYGEILFSSTEDVRLRCAATNASSFSMC